MASILAVDPGGTTGFVVMPRGGVVSCWDEVRGTVPALEWTWRLLSGMNCLDVGVVAVERWTTMRGRAYTNEPEALEVIGGLRWQAAYTKLDFTLQGAADATAWGTKDRLAPYRAAGVGRGGGGHAVSALRHALLYLGTRGRDDSTGDGNGATGP